MPPPPTILVSGAMANKHLNGGEAWVRLNWVLGLRKLRCQVYFVEQIRSDTCVDDAGAPTAFEQSANLRYFDHVVRWFGMEQTASLICDEGRQVHGLRYADLLKAAGRADLLINISGHLRLAAILGRVRRKVYVDVDPGFTQFWHAQGIEGAALEGHDVYLTIGENVGMPACSIPTSGIAWQPHRPFVVLDQWPVCPDGDPNRFTTVGAWRGPFGPVEHEGRRFGLKVHEFRKLITLPQRAPQTFEIALSIDPADRADLEALQSGGWHLVEPREVAGDPLAFRRYVQGSGGEFSAAQGIYVDTQCGWLSDRTVHYLASGKPALVQDTGFSRNYPVGDGLVPFRTLDEAVAGAGRIAQEYAHHSRAARRLAEAYFDSDRVLRDVMGRVGIRLPVHDSGN
jgi:hypothetical protein